MTGAPKTDQPTASEAAPRFPYFDSLFPQLEAGNADIETAFGRHVHWGYWPEPGRAARNAADYGAAAERMTVELTDAAGAADNQSVLDVGCGIGGTIASLNERFSGMRLIGLNIDRRQLDYARGQVKARDGNQVEFVEGSASKLPFPDASFDAVLAVEAIFHFPDRAQFFAEVHRVLKPGGKLALSDFVPAAWILPTLWFKVDAGYYGKVDLRYTLRRYRSLAARTGFKPVVERNVTANTLPTYDYLRSLPRPAEQRHVGVASTIMLYLNSRFGLVRYSILGFEKI